MDVLMLGPTDAAWTAIAGQLQGIVAAAAAAEPVMIHTADPMAEVGEIVALLDMFRSHGGRDDLISVASPYPAPEWISRVRVVSGVRVWYVVPGLRPLRLRLEQRDLVEVPMELCPALHVRKLDGCPTSVCGNVHDRLVLARHLLVERCFGAWATCRWEVGSDAGCARMRSSGSTSPGDRTPAAAVVSSGRD